MASASGIWNHFNPANSVQGNPLAPARSAAAASASPGAGDSGGSTISGNDFLTLLVTEMQNQDPTANTDPNEYINQLVQVNSLEQLININQTLSTSLGTTSSSGSQPNPSVAAAGATSTGVQQALAAAAGPSEKSINTTSGNLSVPAANPAAQRVAQALGHPAL